MGARPLARVIQESIKKPLADEVLFGRLIKGGHVKVGVDAEKDELSFDIEETPPKATPKRKPGQKKGGGRSGDSGPSDTGSGDSGGGSVPKVPLLTE